MESLTLFTMMTVIIIIVVIIMNASMIIVRMIVIIEILHRMINQYSGESNQLKYALQLNFL